MSFKVHNLFNTINQNEHGDLGYLFSNFFLEDGVIITYDTETKLFKFKTNNIRGPRGEKGDIGMMGPYGIMGKRGPQGPQGPEGDIGFQGFDGLKGPIGKKGAIGPQGPIGPQGITGHQGIQGQIGMDGPQGSQGITGPQGKEGLRGEDGDMLQGKEGPRGPSGKVLMNKIYNYSINWHNDDFFQNFKYVCNFMKSIFVFNSDFITNHENTKIKDFVKSASDLLYLGYGNICVIPNIIDETNNIFIYNIYSDLKTIIILNETINTQSFCLLRDSSIIICDFSGNIYRLYPYDNICKKLINIPSSKSIMTLQNGNIFVLCEKEVIELTPLGNIKNKVQIPFKCNRGVFTPNGNILLLPQDVERGKIHLCTLLYNPFNQELKKSRYTFDYVPNGFYNAILLLNNTVLVGNDTDTFEISNPDSVLSTVKKINIQLESPCILPNNNLLTHPKDIQIINKNYESYKIQTSRIGKSLFINKKYYYIDNNNNLNVIDFCFNTGFDDNWDTSLLFNFKC